MLEIKPLKVCSYCKHWQETGFTIDPTAPTHWQQVKRHGICELGQRSYPKDERVPSYHSCDKWTEKERSANEK